ncbi:MAG: thiol protease/hemagglutinin PrtT [Bacteroidales bacterium]|nr:thiol protease/hemagglutinin PrtT [Bacteroidales bacterium]
MKKLLLCFSLMLIVSAVFSAPVDPTTAAKVATNFYRQQTMSKTLFKQQTQPTLLDVTAQTPYQHIYVFNTSDGNGFILVAGDDRSIPVLGYSDEGCFDYDEMPDNARSWIAHYEEELAWIVEHEAIPYETTAAEWETLRQGKLMETKGGSVEPLIKTKWNQAPYYNDKCPYDNVAGERALTGCVATAMAQIMKYWEYPARGTGSHSYTDPADTNGTGAYGTLSANFGNTIYDWSNMPKVLESNSTTAQKNAVATLMYHCGVACDMDYGLDWSGAYPVNAKKALINNFGYSPNLELYDMNDYTYSTWISALKSELDNQRPIYYSGYNEAGKGGHAFVCDGYDNKSYFHFNFGWQGSGDGYFSLLNLAPYPWEDFSYIQSCIIGIQPTSYESKLTMYSSLTTDASNYEFGDDVTVSFSIANANSTNFNGYLLFVLTDATDNYIVDMQLMSADFPSMKYRSGSITFEGYEPMVPGNYTVYVFAGTNSNDSRSFKLVQSTSSATNSTSFTVKEMSYQIETYSNFTFSSGNELYEGRNTEISVSIRNTSSSTLYGTIEMVLADLYGYDEQLLGSFSNTDGFASKRSYTLTTNKTIEVEGGEYLIALYFQPQGSEDWYYVGSTFYNNPRRVTVISAPINPDKYEDNNTATESYLLGTVETSSKTYTIDANFHTTTDRDYYKLNLPSGFKYSITASIQDLNNTSTYTANTHTYISFDGKNIANEFHFQVSLSESDINTEEIYFSVEPQDGASYDLGSYRLTINITRTGGVTPTPDQYEPNNTSSTAYNLGTINSASTSYNINANFHLTTDNDYYKINLPLGYTYTINANLLDSYNDNSYTADAKFAISQNGSSWSSNYGTYMSAMNIENGGTLWFRVLPYTDHEIGTYQLRIKISRINNTGIKDFNEEQIILYPNPASDKLYLTMAEGIEVKQIELLNSTGQLIHTFNGNERDFNVGDLPSGLYIMRIVTSEGVLTKKWVKQ